MYHLPMCVIDNDIVGDIGIDSSGQRVSSSIHKYTTSIVHDVVVADGQ